MKELSKKAVILDNIASDYIMQAIIILKDNPNGTSDKVIKEAEKIVSSYFDSKAYIGYEDRPEKNRKNFILKSALAILSVTQMITIYMCIIK